MANDLRIELGGRTFHADVLADQAPHICRALADVGAFDSIVFSANLCSNEITWPTPRIDLDRLENPVLEEEAGNLVFYAPWSAICAFFGPTEPAGWCSCFARIRPEELADFQEVAGRVWYDQGGIVTTELRLGEGLA